MSCRGCSGDHLVPLNCAGECNQFAVVEKFCFSLLKSRSGLQIWFLPQRFQPPLKLNNLRKSGNLVLIMAYAMNWLSHVYLFWCVCCLLFVIQIFTLFKHKIIITLFIYHFHYSLIHLSNIIHPPHLVDCYIWMS